MWQCGVCGRPADQCECGGELVHVAGASPADHGIEDECPQHMRDVDWWGCCDYCGER